MYRDPHESPYCGPAFRYGVRVGVTGPGADPKHVIPVTFLTVHPVVGSYLRPSTAIHLLRRFAFFAALALMVSVPALAHAQDSSAVNKDREVRHDRRELRIGATYVRALATSIRTVGTFAPGDSSRCERRRSQGRPPGGSSLCSRGKAEMGQRTREIGSLQKEASVSQL
jgi:hypothetical protein